MTRRRSGVNRRQFVEIGAAGVLGSGVPAAAVAAGVQNRSLPSADPARDTTVRLTGDGLSLTPPQYAHLLARLTEEQGVAADDYILGGVVEELESRFARLLGKEAAVFVPTGTLANHLAIRALAGGPARAVVQADSHIYQDSGDCVQTLSNVTMMPLAAGRATFTADELQQLVSQTKGGRVSTRLAVLSIESPVRRRLGEIFDSGELAKVLDVARANGMRLHLDGARLFIEAAYANRAVTEYTAPFETVYVSLYKYFNAASGAILAGPRDLLKDMFHTRRMFGGGLYHAWPFAAVALHFMDGFAERLRPAITASESLIASLQRHEGVTVTRVTPGTNLFTIRMAPARAANLRERLGRDGIVLPAASAAGGFTLAVNETLARMSANQLADAFARALG